MLKPIMPEEKNGLRAFVENHGLRAVIEALADIAVERREDAAGEWLAALAPELPTE